MSLRFIFGRGGSGKTTYCLEEIGKKVNDGNTSPIILLVPEQYTFESEKYSLNTMSVENLISQIFRT